MPRPLVKPPLRYPLRMAVRRSSAYSRAFKIIDANGSILCSGAIGEWGVSALEDMLRRANTDAAAGDAAEAAERAL